MTGRDLMMRVSELECETGTIPLIQKVLLLTDGSVTNFLEVIAGERVRVQTLVQEVVPAGKEQSMRLRIPEGDPVNHRVVNLSGSRTGNIFVRAISDTPLSRLMPAFRQDLMAADIPIGRILMRYQMETRREILDFRAERSDPELAAVFGISPGDFLLCRHYHIVHESLPLISIEEIFPFASPAYECCTGVGQGRSSPSLQRSPASCVTVDAPSRLHLGLIDLNGNLGRVDGGIGVTIADPCTVIEAACGEGLSVSGGDPGSRERVLAAAGAMYRRLGIAPAAAIRIRNTVPHHIGLGSGTQIALAAGVAICSLHGVFVSPRDIASIVNRGGTSGIGTAAFESGGFIL
ncbi:MAG: chorismate pyruvate-lyase family protein, partial [Methanoregulaceae archaeon]|nr:chorismate pyruvate-lyase family protein [Methanoregulaceae archaeon]